MAQAIERRRKERAALEEAERRAAEGYVQRPVDGFGSAVREAALQADADIRSAANTLTLGLADKASAGWNAVVSPSGRGFTGDYATNLAAQQARNAYDRTHRRLAQQAGVVGAAGLAVAVGGLPAAGRLAGAATLSARELLALIGAGGGAGLASQGVVDAAAHRRTGWRDGTGAAVGGMIGGAAYPLGPGRAASIGSAATAAMQNALHGRISPVEELGRSAVAGRAVGGLLGTLASKRVANLPFQTKGKLGEAMGTVRSAINGMVRESGPKRILRNEGGPSTFPDGRSGKKVFEDKFGPTARMSMGQLLAQARLGSDYVLYHFLPGDVGDLSSIPIATTGAHAHGQRSASAQKRR